MDRLAPHLVALGLYLASEDRGMAQAVAVVLGLRVPVALGHLALSLFDTRFKE